MPARSRDRPPGPSADRRRLWVRPASGLFWSMNCESWLVPKNSLMEATTGRMLIRVCGVIASTSWVVIRSRTTRSIRDRPVRTWFWMSSPTLRRRRFPEELLDGGDDGPDVDQGLRRDRLDVLGGHPARR